MADYKLGLLGGQVDLTDAIDRLSALHQGSARINLFRIGSSNIQNRPTGFLEIPGSGLLGSGPLAETLIAGNRLRIEDVRPSAEQAALPDDWTTFVEGVLEQVSREQDDDNPVLVAVELQAGDSPVLGGLTRELYQVSVGFVNVPVSPTGEQPGKGDTEADSVRLDLSRGGNLDSSEAPGYGDTPAD